jgi:hypothetical protein
LAADFVQRIDQDGAEFEHAALESGEQAGGAGADDGDIGGDHAAGATLSGVLRQTE